MKTIKIDSTKFELIYVVCIMLLQKIKQTKKQKTKKMKEMFSYL